MKSFASKRQAIKIIISLYLIGICIRPAQLAKYGYIDDVIEPRNTRFRVIRALQQLQTKKLTNPAKKHGNIPL